MSTLDRMSFAAKMDAAAAAEDWLKAARAHDHVAADDAARDMGVACNEDVVAVMIHVHDALLNED